MARAATPRATSASTASSAAAMALALAVLSLVAAEPAPLAQASNLRGGAARDEVEPRHGTAAPDSEPTARDAVALRNGTAAAGLEPTTLAAWSNRCTETDKKVMAERNGDWHDKHSFPGTVTSCAKKNAGLNGISNKGFQKCMTRAIHGFSWNCAGCFAEAGDRLFHHCLGKCMRDKCSRSCLECTKRDVPELEKCLGVPVPTVDHC